MRQVANHLMLLGLHVLSSKLVYSTHSNVNNGLTLQQQSSAELDFSAELVQ